MDARLGEVKDILIKLHNLGLKAYVAGGFVRDYLNGITPKDIDVFVIGNVHQDDYLKQELLNTFGVGKWYKNYNTMDMRDDVISLLKIDSIDLDIIFMKYYKGDNIFYLDKYSIIDTIRNFDVSLCQCYIQLNNGELEFYVSEDYMDWKNNKICYRYIDVETTDNHLDRVKAKFGIDSFVEKCKNKDLKVVKVGI